MDASKAFNRHPDDSLALDLRSRSNIALGKCDDAIDDASRAVWLSPRAGWPLALRGIAYAARADMREAAKDLEKAAHMEGKPIDEVREEAFKRYDPLGRAARYFRTPSRAELAEESSRLVEEAMAWGSENDKRVTGYSLLRHLYAETVSACSEHVLATGATLGEFVRDFFPPGAEVVRSIQFALSREHNDSMRNVNFWMHEHRPFDLIKLRKTPYFDRQAIETAASKYLELPYRTGRVERLLVDILVAVEMYDYGRQVLLYREEDAYAPLWLRALSALAGSEKRKAENALLLAMIQTYAELSSDGAVSTRRLRDLVSEASQLGVVWPGPLHAIIEDNLARIGRL